MVAKKNLNCNILNPEMKYIFTLLFSASVAVAFPGKGKKGGGGKGGGAARAGQPGQAGGTGAPVGQVIDQSTGPTAASSAPSISPANSSQGQIVSIPSS
jgi:hypothetical protein